MKTKSIIIFLGIVIVLLSTCIYASSNYYKDLEGFEWAEEYIDDYTEKGILAGYGDNLFKPAQDVSREEFAKIIVKAFNFEIIDVDCDFDDVSKTEWYYPYVATLVKNGILKGVGNNKFGVGNPITRQDICTIVYRVLLYKGYKPNANSDKQLPFTDADTIADYAVDAVKALYDLGVISGNDKMEFNPEGNANRASMVKIVGLTDKNTSSYLKKDDKETKEVEESAKPSGEDTVKSGDNTKEEKEEPKKESSSSSSSSTTTIKKYTVTFYDEDETTVLSTQRVLRGKDAEAPNPPEKKGQKFSEWNGSYKNVKKDTNVIAVYKEDDTVYNAYVHVTGEGTAEAKVKNHKVEVSVEPTNEDGTYYVFSSITAVDEDGEEYEFEEKSTNVYISAKKIYSDVDVNVVFVPEIADVTNDWDKKPESKDESEILDYIPIYEASELQQVATSNNVEIKGDIYEMLPGAKYVLMNDLDLSSISNFDPIQGFTGEFDGNGYTISNLTIDNTPKSRTYTPLAGGSKTYPPAALFESVVGGTIKNLGIDSANIQANESVSAIAAQGNDVTIENCFVKDSTLNGKNACGCIIGFVYTDGATITDCKVVNTSLTAQYTNTAGVCGTSEGNISIKNCEIKSDSSEISYEAGIINCSKGTLTIEGCDVQGINATIGGLVRVALGSSQTIKDCNVKGVTIGIPNSSYTTSSSAIIMCTNNSTTISNCKIENIELNKAYFGTICHVALNGIEISNCSVKNITGVDSTVAGIIYCANNGGCDVTIENCTVSDIDYSTTLNNTILVAGIGSIISAKTLTVTDCTVDNYKASNIQYCAGIIGWTNGSGTISNCTASNFDIKCNCENTYQSGSYNYTNYFNYAGIITFMGGSNQDITISDCDVTDTSITFAHNITSSNIAGILGPTQSTNNKVDITNCNVKDLDIDGYVLNLGGIVTGYNYSSSNPTGTISNCSVDGLTIASTEYVSATYIGGINGWSKFNVEKSNVSNVAINMNVATIIFGGISEFAYGDITDCDVEKISISMNRKNSNSGQITAGGISAIEFGSTSSLIKDCDVKGFTVSLNSDFPEDGGNSNRVGGITGMTFSTSISNCTVNGFEFNYSDISNKQTAEFYVGGVTGFFSNGTGLSIEKCNVKDSKINISANRNIEDSTNTYVGGISGFGGKVDKCNIDNVIINISNYKDIDGTYAYYITGAAGGIAGFTLDPITNCTIKDLKLTSYVQVGGCVGLTSSSIDNVDISDSAIIGTDYRVGGFYTGGIAGCSTSNTISDCTVTDTVIKSNTTMGGISAVFSKIEDCTVEGCTITNTNSNTDVFLFAGGIGGVSGSVSSCDVIDTTINAKGFVGGIVGNGSSCVDCTVKDSTIHQSGTITSSGCNFYGGIAGHINNELNNCQVNNINLDGSGFVGGIVGNAGYHEISEVLVKDSTITNNDTIISDSTNYTGGIVGASALEVSSGDVISTTIDGSNIVGGIVAQGIKDKTQYTVILNCNVDDCNINGNGIAGRSVPEIDNCHVTNSTIEKYGILGDAGCINRNSSDSSTKLSITNCSVTDSVVKGGRAVGLNTYDFSINAFSDDDIIECEYENNTTE